MIKLTIFRPCIDLHDGKVKQIVGGSLTDSGAQENFVSDYDARYYADLYQQHQLTGGHVIALGPGNYDAACSALGAWSNGMQYGGGVNVDNAKDFLDKGASHLIVTSFLFVDDHFSWERLEAIKDVVGKSRLVLDLSCRKVADSWFIASNRWQTITDTEINAKNLQLLGEYCDEFLIHAADVEGKQAGIDEELVFFLGKNAQIPTTYAGGASGLSDLERVKSLSTGTIDLTIGSALDIFGGKGVTLEECIAWNKQQ